MGIVGYFLSRNTKSEPRTGKSQASGLKLISRPPFCHQVSIGDQGTLDALITLSYETLVAANKGGKKGLSCGGHSLTQGLVPWSCALN
ncbi:Vascular endothelial growth factor receptor 1 [Gossypium arboreum]|uniref:Vascular endothelial growth factor receptor 1 n=1 Tax=Gossypium arboreum TaxID=29729 RepID=A0A0B0PDK7_GOSAR|nr:Vascular endothelial growth factor receptor 1 [Gossypium arboreum]